MTNLTTIFQSLWIRTRQAASLVRLKPFEGTTPEDRSKERYRRIALTMLTSIGVRGISTLTALITVRLTVNYLGSERYGLWVTIMSVITALGFADLGIGNGLMNAISDANGRDDRESARGYVSSAWFMLTGLSILGGLAFLVLYPIIPWARIFNLTSDAVIAEAGPATAVFVVCFLLNMPLSLVQRIQAGYQEGMTNSLWMVFGYVLGFVALLVAIQARASLPWLVLAMAGTPVFATFLNNVVMFGMRRRWLRPRLSSITEGTAKKIVSVGFLFFVLQVAVAAAYSSDNIVVAQILGPQGVTQYSVPLRLFQIAPQILGMLLYPLWPAYGEAIARGDMAWVRRTLKRSILIGLAINIPPSLFLIGFGVPVIHLWIDNTTITPPFLLLLGFGAWSIMNSFTGPIAMLLNGATVIRFQVICSSIMAVMNLTLSIILTSLIGLPGPIWASIISVTICILIPSALFIPKLLAELAQRNSSR